jgi:RNA binding exosome subunit
VIWKGPSLLKNERGENMRKIMMLTLFALAMVASSVKAGFWDQAKEIITPASQESPDESTIVSGLKEALSQGAGNAVSSVAKLDGYFGNEAIKILMPEKIRTVADTLKKFGFQQQVDDFVLSMNRAAEHAAPQAKSYFVDAIKEMSFEDAQKILKGNDTAATDYFKAKMQDKLYAAFEPSVSSSMNEVGATRAYKNMMDKYTTIPFVKAESLDLDHYVTEKSLDGLFYTVGQEEKKIRTDPAARTTDLLKKVFAGS